MELQLYPADLVNTLSVIMLGSPGASERAKVASEAPHSISYLIASLWISHCEERRSDDNLNWVLSAR
jgi:hypothetical protein